MTVYNKLRYILAVLVVVGTLFSLTACKKTTDVPVSDISVDTGATTEVADTATTTDAATTETTTTATTVATTKAPTTTTRTPNTTAKPVVNQTTKAPTTQTQTRKTQLDALGVAHPILTPEERCKEQHITMDEYKVRLEKCANFKCPYCNDHNCASLVYNYDTNGDANGVTQNKWKCAAYVASEPKCDRCGKKLCASTDPNAKRDDYCIGGCGFTIE